MPVFHNRTWLDFERWYEKEVRLMAKKKAKKKGNKECK